MVWAHFGSVILYVRFRTTWYYFLITAVYLRMFGSFRKQNLIKNETWQKKIYTVHALISCSLILAEIVGYEGPNRLIFFDSIGNVEEFRGVPIRPVLEHNHVVHNVTSIE